MQRKNKVIIVVITIFIVLAFVVYGYFWYVDANTKKVQAESVIGMAQQYEGLVDKINIEKQRCEQFISQESGQFSAFEYCQKFIAWQNQLGL